MRDFQVIQDGEGMWTVRSNEGADIGYILHHADKSFRSCRPTGGIAPHCNFIAALMELVGWQL
ncbi:hypothetical protein UFOVP62_44 [uncultured Caudovirales phage]|uniref:Uncharacterized protein n=1 Tax=uncultured Caudovirales phage TaxID=2100421 RepID=A0A6J5KR26_9CAUD|nr:hypothetical protein UFOVP62_44 [uncultured Caudovirales phage]